MMRKGFLASLLAFLAGNGLAWGQAAPEFRPAQGYTLQPYQAAWPSYGWPNQQGMPAQYGYPQQYGYMPQYRPAPQYGQQQWGYPPGRQGWPNPYMTTGRQIARTGNPQVPQHLPPPIRELPQAPPRQAPAAEPLAAPRSDSPAVSSSTPEKINPPVSSVPRESYHILPAPTEVVECQDCVQPAVPCKQPKCDKECRFWTSVEYLHWLIKDGPSAAPLLTSGVPGALGILGNPGTTVLFGGAEFDYDDLSGLRFSTGFWIKPWLAIEAGGFLLEQGADGLTVVGGGSGLPLLARPIIDSRTGLPSSALVSAPGSFNGTSNIASTTQLWGAETNILLNAYRGCYCRINLLAGLRYLDLEEDLIVSQTSSVQGGIAAFNGGGIGPGSLITASDFFDTRNQFYGGQVGFQGGVQKGRWFMSFTGKAAVGSTYQRSVISGTSTLLAAGTTTTVPGGILAVPSNFGRTANHRFTIVPEGSLEVGYQITPRISASIGYTFLWWNHVARPGDQVNPLINPTQVPSSLFFGVGGGAPQPIGSLRDDDFWAQGITAGIAIRY